MTENLAAKNKPVLLSEEQRLQYLKAMGIQTWFDPAAPVSENIQVQNIETPVAEPVISVADNSLTNKPDSFVSETTVSSENSAPASLDALAIKISRCELCELHTSRQQAISGEGADDAKIFIIIDAPLNDEAGEYALFNSADKKMLQAMLRAIGYSLSSVFMTSLVKCRPAGQRAPQTSEMICCDDHLSVQINLIKPDVILVMGEQASQQLLVSQKSLTDLRLRHHNHLGVPVYASYHPHDLFDSSQTRRKVWADLLQIKQHLK